MNGSASTSLSLLAIALVIGGCAGDSGEQASTVGPVVRVPDRPLRPAAAGATTTTDRFARGLPSRAGSTTPVPPAPNSLGELASESITAVVGVHNVASSVGRPLKLPRGALHGQAVDVRDKLSALQTRLRRPSRGLPAELSRVLNGYLGIATTLARRAQPLAAPARARLAALDIRWRRALRAIGRPSGSDLAASVPSLPRPNIPAPARPSENAR